MVGTQKRTLHKSPGSASPPSGTDGIGWYYSAAGPAPAQPESEAQPPPGAAGDFGVILGAGVAVLPELGGGAN